MRKKKSVQVASTGTVNGGATEVTNRVSVEMLVLTFFLRLHFVEEMAMQ